MDLESYRKVFADNFGRLLGCEMTAISSEKCVYLFHAKEEHWNPNGVVHGGALFAAMDSCQGAFVHFILDLKKEFGTTAEASMRFKKPHRLGPVTITTTLRDRKRNIMFVQTVAENERGETVALVSEKWMVLPRSRHAD